MTGFGGEVTEDCKNGVFGGRQAGFDAGAAKLQMGIAFKKMPSDAGAGVHGALETFVGGRGIFLRRIAGMWIEYQQNAEIIFAGKFADHQ